MKKRKKFDHWYLKCVGVCVAVTVGVLILSALVVCWVFLILQDKQTPLVCPPPVTAPIVEVVPPKVLVYFGNSNIDKEFMDCTRVFAVERDVLYGPLSAVNALLAGPLLAEQNGGYFSSINSGTKINSLTFSDDIAFVDFDEKIEEGLGGSCRVGHLRSQIIKTLKQFPEIKDVVISVSGRTDDALQP